MTPEAQIQKILTDNELELGYLMDFPQYKILPSSVQLALKVLEEHKMQLKMVLKKAVIAKK